MKLLEYSCRRLEHLLSTFKHDDLDGLVEHAAAILSPDLLLVAFMIVALVDLEFEEL
jgi:hypothetical protein